MGVRVRVCGRGESGGLWRGVRVGVCGGGDSSEYCLKKSKYTNSIFCIKHNCLDKF